MNTNIACETDALTDASLVASSLAGNRDAFGQIVSRYQSSVCALAFSACGDMARSEDIAQEVFIAAWRQLATLREPAKFKQWLYGITRNLIHNTFRKSTRNPLSGAEPFEVECEQAYDAAKPDEELITKEEEIIVRHALFGLPAVFREAMVLYYRQDESIREVADTLSISEEAARQRLVRGRALLNERVASIVQHGLKRSGPAGVFTAGVIAALPLTVGAPAAKGAVMGVAASQTLKSPAAGAMMALKAVAIFAALLLVPAGLGAFFGHLLGKDAANSGRRESVRRFLRVFALGLGVLAFLPFMLTLGIAGHLEGQTRAAFLSVMIWWMELAYGFVLCAVVYWDIRRRFLPTGPAGGGAADEAPGGKSRRMALYLTAAAAGLLVFCLFDTNIKVGNPSPAQLRQIFDQTPANDLAVSILEGRNHTLFGDTPGIHRTMWVTVEKDGSKEKYAVDVSPEALALVTKKGIKCPTLIAGRDYEILGAPGRSLPLLAAFLLAAGGVFLWERRRASRRTG